MIGDKSLENLTRKLSLQEQNLIYTINIIRYLGSEKVSNLLISFFLDLASKESNEGRLIQMDCYSSFGKTITNLYIFTLYARYCKFNQTKITLSEWKDSKVVDL